MRWIFAAAVAFPTLVPAPAPALAGEPVIPQFIDETARSGLEANYAGDWQYMVGGGVSTFDCNGDTLPDMVLAGGENPASLWVNQSTPAALQFAKSTAGVELTAVTGTYPIDIDSDGISDLVVLRIGENVMLRGLGQCQFTRANEDWGFDGGDAWTTAFAATWEKGADWPTLAIGNYVDRTAEAFPWGSCTPNWLHRPGDKGFAPPLPLTPSYCALSILFTDWNNSGTPALRVSNDREYYKGGQEQMWHIQPGQPPRLYTEQDGWARLRIWGMGIATDDLDGDGLPEYFLTSMADNKLQGLAQPTGPLLPKYVDTAFKRGAIAQRPYIGEDLNPSTAWHAQFADVNNDGLADIFIAKGNVSSMPDFALHDPNNLLLQRTDGTFAEVGDKAGVASMRTARGAQVVDLNGDGRLDLVVVNRNADAQLWRNGGPVAGHWLALHLHQSGTNPDAIGARIEVSTPNHRYTRETTLGGGHVSGSLGVQHFGLGPSRTAQVTVTWPDGTRTGPFDLKADAVWEIAKETGPRQP